ncbi:scavenger receptor cysteine-rich type 1 M130-like protein [Labeo rohita]|uniref:Scavenger receptor cysteine-rich type 1 M130-like protein n=1 Tax=Labeo rohita TaxID=84645 RepID=A0A498L2D6_LABRO|nr:scavenger receptor cysteine-rich type 1 M130-like protein [Labeo rohita]
MHFEEWTLTLKCMLVFLGIVRADQNHKRSNQVCLSTLTALSKRRHRMTSEAVYEEIQHRHNHFTQRGSLISEELHSGYENADELLSVEEFKTAYYDDVTNGSGLKEEMVKEITPEYYDDVITDGLKPDRETEDTLESYDDVMKSGQNSDIKKVDAPENYDDVIVNRPSSQGVTEGVQEEYDDVTSVSEDVRNLLDSSLALHDGLVRLSGERQCEGEVEVFIHQVWRRVLLDSWSLTESSVVCRQLGCGSVLNFYGSSSSSPEHSHECVTGFQCSGSEAHLGNCSSPQTLNCSSTQQLSITCLEFKEIRLTEGCDGNVEVFYNGSWARVKSAPNWLDKVTCRPHDLNLWQCPSSPWGQNNCEEEEVAKITCSEEETRESPQSRLTCFTSPSPYQRQCTNFPDLSVSTTPATRTSASPTVRSTSVTPPQTLSTVPPQSPVPLVLVIVLVVVLLLLLVPLLILIQQNRVMRRALSKRRHRTTTEAVYEEIQRRHSHFTQRGSLISEELHSGYEDADELLSDSSLALHDGLVRLSGERQCEGEVEVFIHQVWRRVLLDSWSLTESSVVCRQLGCGSVLNFYGSSSSSPEHSHECVTGFQCSGSEAHLGNCSSPQTLNCSSTQQLSITCLDFKEIRLTKGCEGNVEVFYNGSWGNVCYNQMDRDTASLICQELNCGRSGVLYASTTREKSAPNWLDEVKCRPYDLNLWQCPSAPWGQNNCGEDEVAKITCSEEEAPETPQSRLTCFVSPSPYQRKCTQEMVKEITPGYYDDVITDGLKADHETVGDQEEYDDVKNSNKNERNLLVPHKTTWGRQKVIDVGSGKGYLCSYLSMRFDLQVFGIDSSSANTHEAQERNRKLKKFSKAYQKSN